MLPPSALSKYTSHDNVLHVLGREVKSLLPVTCQCPLCIGTLTVYADPIVASWYHCPTCSFAGDAIDLYKTARNITDSHAAVESMVSDGINFTIPLSPDIINTYDLGIPSLVRRGSAFWKAARSQMLGTVLSPVTIDLLHKYSIYPGWSQISWEDKLGKWVGATTYKMLEEYDIVGPNVQKRWHDALVIPTYDLPGRVRGFTFLSNRNVDVIELSMVTKAQHGYIDGGLMFLDAVAGHNTVFAVGNPLVALQLHIRNFMSSNKPIPVISFTETAKSAWNSLTGKRVILWDYAITPQLIKHATYLFKAEIATRPKLEAPSDYNMIYEQMRNRRSSGETLEAMQNSAKPWQNVLKDHLLSLPVAAAALFLEQVELDPQDLDKLLDCCSTAEKPAIKQCFDGAVIEKERHYGKQLIVEKPDGYYLRTFDSRRAGTRGADRKISNIKLDIAQAVRYPKLNETIYSGNIIVNGKPLEFDDLTEENIENIYPWINAKVLDSGYGYPQVNKEWESKLFSLGVTMQVPAVRKGIDYIGKLSNGAICLPQMLIKDGERIPHDHKVLRTKELPMAKVTGETVDSEDLQRYLNDTEALQNFWALSSVVLSAILTGKKSMVSIYVKDASSFLPCFAKTFGLTERGNFIVEPVHGVPTVIRPHTHIDTSTYLTKLRAGSSFGTICALGKVAFIAASLFPKSTTIDIADCGSIEENSYDALLPIFSEFLAYCQQHQDGVVFSPIAVLSHFKRFLTESCEHERSLDVLDKAIARIHAPQDIIGINQRIVAAVRRAVDSSIVRPATLDEDLANIYRINYGRIRKSFEDLDLPIPAMSDWVDHFTETGTLIGVDGETVTIRSSTRPVELPPQPMPF